MKTVIINADDFGLCESVNKGIIKCLECGTVSDLSFMINLDEFDKSARILERLNIRRFGFHLNITVGKSILGGRSKLADRYGNYLDLSNLVFRMLIGRISANDIYLEIRCQLEFLIKQGYTITHIDSHRNVHLLPWIIRPLILLNNELGLHVPIRVPLEKIYFSKVRGRSVVRIFMINILSTICLFVSGYRRKMRTIGGSLYDNPNMVKTFENILRIVGNSSYEKYEIAVHPGYTSKELSKYDPYTTQRTFEIDSLKSLRPMLRETNISLISH